MKRYILHSPFSIYHFEAATWGHAVHKHTYFEIIFILKGRGSHHINGAAYCYEAGDVFLLGPEDYHHFSIDELTEFCFVRFNESMDRPGAHDRDRPWQPIIRNLLNTPTRSRRAVVTDSREKHKLHHLLSVLEDESGQEQAAYYEVVRDGIMRTMLVMLARNLFDHGEGKPVMKDSVENMLMYIRQNIHVPENLTIAHLAQTFHYAPNYISLFFKKQVGESLKQYILRHKVKLIEARLLYSGHSLKEIADDFGYTDESHFCKQFKKYTGKSPSTFRNAP